MLQGDFRRKTANGSKVQVGGCSGSGGLRCEVQSTDSRSVDLKALVQEHHASANFTSRGLDNSQLSE